jgi:hypothetical protein
LTTESKLEASPVPSPPIDEAAFPPWSDNFIVHFFLYQLKPLGYFLPAAVAVVYWLLPLLLSAWDGTLVSGARVDSAIRLFTELDWPSSVVDIAKRFKASQKLQAPDSLPYLQDLTHFVFALTLSLGALVSAMTIKNFNRTVAILASDQIPHADPRQISEIYQQYRKKAFQRRYVFLCLVLGLAAFLLFLYLYASPRYAYWWGSHQHGSAGLLFAIIVGGMVFSALWGLVILIFGAAMLARIFSLPMDLRPFHRDGCNGLAPLGRQIFLLWGNALFGGIAIYVALRLGYLGIQRTPIVWVLAVLGSAGIPLIAIVPLYASLQAVKRAQNANLQQLGRFLNRQLEAADTAIQNGNFPAAHETIAQLTEVKDLFEIYKTTNVWPFNPKALTFILIANAIQIALTVKELMSLIPK